eukprot:c24542_g1_i1 orf=354-1322(-)
MRPVDTLVDQREVSDRGVAMEQFLIMQLLDSSLPISHRFRALFSLRNLKGPLPREALIAAMRDPSNLLAHEAAFALGQMRDTQAIPALKTVLEDTKSFHPIVRHEAAEALGAIGLPDCVSILMASLESDPAQEVRETCDLALQRIQEGQAILDDLQDKSPFLSVDPAVAASLNISIANLREVLLDEAQSMYNRYAALFALRNQGAEEATGAIIAALRAGSALLRHEVAYVLGQLQDKVAKDALAETLKDLNEHPMVRHEAAEALGSIADNDSIALLRQFRKDKELIVSQSCEVALSMLEFEQNGKAFEYLYLETPTVTENAS